MSFNDQPNRSQTRGSCRDHPDVTLQIGRPGKETLQFPALIRNLTAGRVSLEVVNPLAIMKWEDLKGQGGRLRVPANGNGDQVDFLGKVVRVNHFSRGRGKGLLSLDLALGHPTPAAQKLLNDHIPHRPRDTHGLWERWDQSRLPAAQRVVAIPARVGFVGLTLLICGLILHSGGAGVHPLLAWSFWVMGTLAVLGQILLLCKET